MPPNVCPAGKILNPETGRYVKKDGKIGKALLKNLASIEDIIDNIPIPKTISRSKSGILQDLQSTCNNDTDPITLDKFIDMSLEDLETLVKIGNGDKKNCYTLDNIYQVYKLAVLSNKHPKDPMDPSHILTEAEIEDINYKMKTKDINYEPPKYEAPRPYPNGYELVIDLDPRMGNMFRIKINFRRRMKHDLGYIPAWIETHHTGSADYTSAVLISNIRELWDKRLLTDNIETSGCCAFLKKTLGYWQSPQWKRRFIDMCEQVKELLDS